MQASEWTYVLECTPLSKLPALLSTPNEIAWVVCDKPRVSRLAKVIVNQRYFPKRIEFVPTTTLYPAAAVLYTVEFQCPGTHGCSHTPCEARLRVDIIADRLDTARLFRARPHGPRFQPPSPTALDHHTDLSGPRALIAPPGAIHLPPEVATILSAPPPPPASAAAAAAATQQQQPQQQPPATGGGDAAATKRPLDEKNGVTKRARVDDDETTNDSDACLRFLREFAAAIKDAPLLSLALSRAAIDVPPAATPAPTAVLDRSTVTLPIERDAGLDFPAAFVDAPAAGFDCCAAAVSVALFGTPVFALKLRCAVVKQVVENTQHYLYRYATAACRDALLAATMPDVPFNLIALSALANAFGRTIVLLGEPAATIVPMVRNVSQGAAPIFLHWRSRAHLVPLLPAAAAGGAGENEAAPAPLQPPTLPPLFKSSVMASQARPGVVAPAPAPQQREFDEYFATAVHVRGCSAAEHSLLQAFVDGKSLLVDSDAECGALEFVMRMAGLAQSQEDRSSVLLLAGDAAAAWNCGGLPLALLSRIRADAIDRIAVVVVARAERATVEQWNECDRVLRDVQKNTSIAFGGLQCVIVGDFGDDQLAAPRGSARQIGALLAERLGVAAPTSLRSRETSADGVRSGAACALYGSDDALQSVPKHDGGNERDYVTLVSNAEQANAINRAATVLRKAKRFDYDVGTTPHGVHVYGAKRRFNHRVWTASDDELGRIGLRADDFPHTDALSDRQLALWPGCRVLLTAAFAANLGTGEPAVPIGSVGTVVGLVCSEEQKQTPDQLDRLSVLPLVQFELGGGDTCRRVVRFRRWTAMLADKPLFSHEQIPLVLAFAVAPPQLFAPLRTDVFVSLEHHWPNDQKPSTAALAAVVAQPSLLWLRSGSSSSSSTNS